MVEMLSARKRTIIAAIVVVAACFCVTLTLGLPPSPSSLSSSFSSFSSFTQQLWSQLPDPSSLTFASFLLLPFSFSAFPLAYLLFRKPTSTPTISPSLLSPSTSPIKHYSKADSTDIVIIGAGVAGSILGLSLARRGFTVRLIELNLEEPHRIVGELLQPGGVKLLQALGLGDCLINYDAQIIQGYTILLKNQPNLVLKYPLLNQQPTEATSTSTATSTAARETGRSFHNGRFVQKLREMVQQQSGCSLTQGLVTSLIEDEENPQQILGVQYQYKDPQNPQNLLHSSHYAALTVIADGCLSHFRRDLIYTPVQKFSSFVGLVLKDCPLPTPLHGHVILADPTPILAYPISSTEVRMLVDFPHLPPSRIALLNALQNEIRSQLPESMLKSYDTAIEELLRTNKPIPSMPNQSLTSRPITQKSGLLMIGDSFNMRHPLTGGGMTVAINDVVNLLTLLESHTPPILDLNHSPTINTWIQQHYQSRDSRVKVINILADALYNVFCEKYNFLRMACFQYLSYDSYAIGPVQLLSGVSSNQFLLIYHFFNVAWFGIAAACYPYPTIAKLQNCKQMLRDACRIILPLLEKENNYLVVRIIVKMIGWILWI